MLRRIDWTGLHCISSLFLSVTITHTLSIELVPGRRITTARTMTYKERGVSDVMKYLPSLVFFIGFVVGVSTANNFDIYVSSFITST